MHKSIIASAIITISVLSGCGGKSSLYMPHYYSEAVCESGTCSSGRGRLSSKTMPIKYEGFFNKENQPTSGSYIVEFKDIKYKTNYNNGLPTEGAKLYTNSSSQADIFVGEFKQYKGPYSKSRISIPYKGEYTDFNGYKYTGTFISYPSMGLYAEHYRKHPTVRRSPFASIVFVGTISYQDQKEVGVYVNESYLIGSQLNHFEPTDETAIKGLERKYHSEYNSHQNSLARKERARSKSKINWGQVFALTAGAVMVKNSNMDIESQSKFIDAYVSDVMNGTTSNLSKLSKNLNNGQSTDKAFRQSYMEAQAIANKYSAKKKSAPTLYEQSLARINNHKSKNSHSRQKSVNKPSLYQQQLDRIAKQTKSNGRNTAKQKTLTVNPPQTYSPKPNYFNSAGAKSRQIERATNNPYASPPSVRNRSSGTTASSSSIAESCASMEVMAESAGKSAGSMMREMGMGDLADMCAKEDTGAAKKKMASGTLYCKSGDLCAKYDFEYASDRKKYLSGCAQVASCNGGYSDKCSVSNDKVRNGRGTVDWTIFAYNGLVRDSAKNIKCD